MFIKRYAFISSNRPPISISNDQILASRSGRTDVMAESGTERGTTQLRSIENITDRNTEEWAGLSSQYPSLARLNRISESYPDVGFIVTGRRSKQLFFLSCTRISVVEKLVLIPFRSLRLQAITKHDYPANIYIFSVQTDSIFSFSFILISNPS